MDLPPNLTSHHQPLDQGIIAAFKKRYRYRLLESYDSIINDWAAVRELGKLKKAGARGIKYGYTANVNDACELSKECWDAITSDTVINCMIKADCLPDVILNKILPLTEKGRKLLAAKGPCAALTIDDEIDINVIVAKMDNLVDAVRKEPEKFRDSRNALPQPFQHLGPKPASEAEKVTALLSCITIEDHSDVKEAIVEDELNLAVKFDVNLVLQPEDEEADVVVVAEGQPWTPSSVNKHKQDLLATLKRYGGKELEKEGEALMEKLARAMLAKATVQTAITGYFGKA